MTIGQEIVEETGNSIIIKDLLNPAEMPFDKTVRRMFIIVKSMHEDLMTALTKHNLSLVEDVRSRDTEVDRLHWLISRQHNLLLRNVSLTEKMGVDIETATKYYLISKIMERIGDHGVRISRYARILIEKKVGKKTIETIKRASALSLELFNQSIDSFFRMDLSGSNRNIDGAQEVEDLCDEINTYALKYKGKTALAVSSIAGSIRRVSEYSVNISENVINHIVAQPDE
jgi:phosphate uptake regulator